MNIGDTLRIKPEYLQVKHVIEMQDGSKRYVTSGALVIPESMIEVPFEISWAEFKSGKVAVICTKENVNSFLAECVAHGVTTCSGRPATTHPANNGDWVCWSEEGYSGRVAFQCAFTYGKLEYIYPPHFEDRDCPVYYYLNIEMLEPIDVLQKIEPPC